MRSPGTKVTIAFFQFRRLPTNRPLLLILGLGGCLGFGAVIGFLVDFATQKFWTFAEVEKLLGLPVLAEIPEILTEDELALVKRRKTFRTVTASTLVVLMLCAGTILYSSTEFRSFAAKHLDRLV